MDRTYINQQAEARVKARQEACRRHEVQLQAMQSGKSFKWDAVEEVSRLVTRARSLGMTSDADELMRDPSNIRVGNRIFEKIIDANNLLDISYLGEGTRGVARSGPDCSAGARWKPPWQRLHGVAARFDDQQSCSGERSTGVKRAR